MSNTPPISKFFLYGEPAKPAGAQFAHLELLDRRSRAANWIIRPHAHPVLHQVFFVDKGGGRAVADEDELGFDAPCVVVVPAGIVHGFIWREDSEGRVLTFSDAFLRAIAARDRRVLEAFSGGLWHAPAQAFAPMLDVLDRELAWAAPGHELAVEAGLSAILVALLRLHNEAAQQALTPLGAPALLVARYREFLEADYRGHPAVAEAARNLGVSPSRLRAACQEAAGASPAKIMHDRLMLEARRLMRYSNMSVAQVAAYLGFDDPAYFSRFFARAAGVPPRVFRNEARREAAARAEAH